MNREEYMLKILRVAAITSLVLGTIALGAGAAGADNPPNTCTGTLLSPGVLAGTYHGDVVVTGLCLVDGGAAVIKGDLILAPGAALGGTYIHNDVAGTGTSSLTVLGDVEVGSDAVLAMGCDPKTTTPCTDDPNATGQNRVTGDVRGKNALGIIVYASTIKGDLSVHGGGGGVTCAPPFPGIFAAVGSPAFSDAEDNTIGGDLKITGLQTCWAGAMRNSVRGNVSFADNTMADPTASLLLANHVGGSIACFGNTPAVQYSTVSSLNSPNLVRQDASGECGFRVRLPNPSPDGPLTLISVKV
jgi:hypothetical protein